MRVISQDGTIDVPYDIVVVQRYKNDIYFLNRNLTGIEKLIDDIKLARYSTEEKAIKAMEMLRNAYMGMTEWKNEPADKDWSWSNTRPTAVTLLNPFEPTVRCEYFRFPQDDEIEV